MTNTYVTTSATAEKDWTYDDGENKSWTDDEMLFASDLSGIAKKITYRLVYSVNNSGTWSNWDWVKNSGNTIVSKDMPINEMTGAFENISWTDLPNKIFDDGVLVHNAHYYPYLNAIIIDCGCLDGGYPEGDYTKGDPIYTNVNIMDETFSKEEVDVIKGLIPEENYDELFVTPTKIGSVMTKEITMRDGRKGRYIDCNLPGGNSYDAITCEDGMIYFRSYGYPRIGLETNDKEFTGDILPEFVDGDVPLNVQANYEPAEIFESEFGMPEIKLSETGFEITDNNHEMLKQRIDSLPDSEKYMIYRADNKVFSLRENRGNPIYYNYNMNGDTIYLRDVIYDFPSSCEDEILEQLEIYKKQYGIAWTSDFDISELSYDDVNFNLDSNSVVIYIDYYPYRITYKGHEDILNPDIIPSSDSAMIALLKIGKLTCADGTELNFNFVDCENSMEGLSLTVNGNEPSEIHSKLDMRKVGYGSAYYYYDGEGNQYLSIFNEGWLDEYFGNFLYKISDGNYQFLYSDNEHTQTFTQVSDILKYAGD